MISKMVTIFTNRSKRVQWDKLCIKMDMDENFIENTFSNLYEFSKLSTHTDLTLIGVSDATRVSLYSDIKLQTELSSSNFKIWPQTVKPFNYDNLKSNSLKKDCLQLLDFKLVCKSIVWFNPKTKSRNQTVCKVCKSLKSLQEFEKFTRVCKHRFQN